MFRISHERYRVDLAYEHDNNVGPTEIESCGYAGSCRFIVVFLYLDKTSMIPFDCTKIRYFSTVRSIS